MVGAKGELIGILTHRDYRFAEDPKTPVSALMTSESLATVREPVDLDAAKRVLQQRRIEKLLVVDDAGRCIGLLTVKDIEKAVLNPQACKDNLGRLRVAAATTVGDAGFDRSAALIDAGVDLIVIDTAHGHSRSVGEAVTRIKKHSNAVQVVAGNVATAEGARALIDSGADAIKVGIGPGSICTTRIVAGVGVPQLTAVMECAEAAAAAGAPRDRRRWDQVFRRSRQGDRRGRALRNGRLDARGHGRSAGRGVSPSGPAATRRIAAWARSGAMARGSADRYFQREVTDAMKLVPEGVEGQVPYKGSVNTILHQMVGGLRAAMGYTGCATIEQMRGGCRFVKITNAGLRESHVHDVMITREAPNYREGG